jgi:hypothetical protein
MEGGVEQLLPLLEKSPLLATVLAVVYLYRENKRLSKKLVDAYKEMLLVYTQADRAVRKQFTKRADNDGSEAGTDADAAGSRKAG